MPTVTVTLPKRHDSQQQIVDECKRFNVLACGRRFGKTTLGLDRCTTPDVLKYPIGWFSPTYKDVLEVWREADRTLQPIITRRSVQERRLEFVTGGLLEFWSLENEDAGRGRKYKRVILDEAAMAPKLKRAWEEAIRPTLSDYQGDAWFLSTPKGRNYFWQLYQWGVDPGHEDWVSWSMPTSANPLIAPEEIEAARLDLPELTFEQEYLAVFLENEGAVFRNIAACMNAPTTQPKDHEGHYLVAGVDWGKQADFTAISIGCATCKHEVAKDRFNQIDYVYQRGRLKAMCDKWNVAQVVAESNAMGEPIIEQLLMEGVPVKPFQTTAQSKPPLIEGLALTFEREEFQFVDDPVWTGELEAYERKISPITGRSQYSAPEGFHDDTVMGRALMVHGAINDRWLIF